MKNIVSKLAIVGLMGMNLAVFANSAAPTAPANSAPAPVTEQAAPAKTAKLSRSEARKACRAENPGKKGAVIAECVKNKLGK